MISFLVIWQEEFLFPGFSLLYNFITMENLPLYVSVVFVITTFITVFLFWITTGRSRVVLLVSLAWLALQAIIEYSKLMGNIREDLQVKFMINDKEFDEDGSIINDVKAENNL